MLHTRRALLKGVFGALSAGGLVALTGWRVALAADTPPIIEVTARRFSFTPNLITAKAGEKVVLEVRSVDFAHGMNFPDFNLRFDLLPGRVTRIELPAQKAGTYEFLCDNFCGDGHEEMNGKLVVTS